MKPFIILLALCLSVAGTAQKSAGVKKKTPVVKKSVEEKTTGNIPLSFENYMILIRGQLPELKQSEFLVRRARLGLTRARSVDDFILNLNAGYFKKNSLGTDGTYGDDHNKGSKFGGRIEKVFSLTGTRLGVGAEYADVYSEVTIPGVRMDPLTGLPQMADMQTQDTYYQPKVTFEFTQPLLHNTFGVLDRFNADSAKQQLDITKLQKGEMDRMTLTVFKKAYFQWAFLKTVLFMLEKSVRNAKTLEGQIYRKFSSGLADNDDLKNARSAVLQYQIQYERNMTSLETLKNHLSLFFDVYKYRPAETAFDDRASGALSFNYPVVAFEKTRGHRILQLKMENLKLQKDASVHRLFPKLNITGQVSRLASETGAADALAEMDRTDYAVGINLSYPLLDRNGWASHDDARVAIQDHQEERRRQKRIYENTLKNILSNIKSTRRLLDLKKKNIAALRSRYATERKKYFQARFSLSFLIDTENRITAEQIEALDIRRQAVDLYYDYLGLVRE